MPSVVSLLGRVLFAVFAALLGQTIPAGAQSPSSAERSGPRFLLASASSGKRVEVDVRSVPLFRRRVSLTIEDAKLGEALKAIGRQTGMLFSYDPTLIVLERPVTVRADGLTLAATLTEVLFDAGLDVLVADQRHLALVPRPVPPQPGSVTGRVTDTETGQGIESAEVLLEGTRWHTLTGSDGRYRLAEVDTGTRVVTARRIGYTKQSRSVFVAEGQELTADFALTQAPTQLEELVTVTPGGIQTQLKAVPSPITVITAADIEAQRPQTINDVVRQAVPSAVGFDIPMQPGASALSMRGATTLENGSQGAKILIDGVEASNFLSSPVNPSSIDRVEVIRGPQAATLYGSDAAGGVIQIFTKRGGSTLGRPEVTLGAELGVLQTPYAGFKGVVRQSYTAEVRGGTAETSYNLGGTWWRLADWLDEGASTSSQSVPSIFGGLRYARGIVSLDLSSRYQVTNNWANLNPLLHQSGFVPLSRPSFLKQQRTNQTVGARLGITPTEWWQNRLTLGVDGNSADVVQTRPRLTTPDDTLLNVTASTQAKLSLGYSTALTWSPGANLSATLTAGVDHYRQPSTVSTTPSALNTEGTISLAPGQTFNVGRTVITNTGYFGQLEVGIREQLFLTVGLRADHNSAVGEDVGATVFPRVGLAYSRELGTGLTVKTRASYGGAIRAPAPDATFGTVSPFLIILANPLLRPVRQRGWDGGLDLLFGSRGSLSVTLYDQDADDLIQFVLVATEPLSTFQNQNVGRVTNRGLEMEGTLNLFEGRVLVRGQYAYTFARIDDLGADFLGDDRVGDRPRGIPTHTAGAALTVTPRTGTGITGGLTYVGSFRETDVLALFRCFGGTGPCQAMGRDYIADYPGFVKLNLAVKQLILPRLSGFVSVDNLTNNLAQEGGGFVPVQGRLTSVGVQLRY